MWETLLKISISKLFLLSNSALLCRSRLHSCLQKFFTFSIIITKNCLCIAQQNELKLAANSLARRPENERESFFNQLKSWVVSCAESFNIYFPAFRVFCLFHLHSDEREFISTKNARKVENEMNFFFSSPADVNLNFFLNYDTFSSFPFFSLNFIHCNLWLPWSNDSAAAPTAWRLPSNSDCLLRLKRVASSSQCISLLCSFQHSLVRVFHSRTSPWHGWKRGKRRVWVNVNMRLKWITTCAEKKYVFICGVW